MKKLYTVLAAAVVAFSASADLYLVGDGEGLGWEPSTPFVVTPGADNGYNFTIKSVGSLKISTAFGSWEDFNAGALRADVNGSNLGEALDLVAGDANILLPWKGDYTFVVNSELNKITITTTTPRPEGYTKIYLRGEMNNWGNDAESLAKYELQTEDGVTYWINCTGETQIPANTTFKVADANWGSINYGAGTGNMIVADEFPVYWNYNADGGMIEEDYVGTISIVLPETPMAPLEVTIYPGINSEFGAVNNVEIENNAPAEYFNLQGIRVSNPSKGLYIVRRGNEVSKVIKK